MAALRKNYRALQREEHEWGVLNATALYTRVLLGLNILAWLATFPSALCSTSGPIWDPEHSSRGSLVTEAAPNLLD